MYSMCTEVEAYECEILSQSRFEMFQTFPWSENISERGLSCWRWSWRLMSMFTVFKIKNVSSDFSVVDFLLTCISQALCTTASLYMFSLLWNDLYFSKWATFPVILPSSQIQSFTWSHWAFRSVSFTTRRGTQTCFESPWQKKHFCWPRVWLILTRMQISVASIPTFKSYIYDLDSIRFWWTWRSYWFYLKMWIFNLCLFRSFILLLQI